MATSGNIANVDSAGALASILNLVTGSKSTSTTTPNISGQGINAILQQILGSTQGLASVASGEKSAGLYNSTVNTQLINDLTTRTAGELASKSAGSTTTQRTPAKLDFNSILTLLAAQGIGKIAGPSLKKLGSPLDDLGKNISDWFSNLGSGVGGTTQTLAPISSVADAVPLTTSGVDIAGSLALPASTASAIDIGASGVGAGALGSSVEGAGLLSVDTAALTDAATTATIGSVGSELAGSAAIGAGTTAGAGVGAAAGAGEAFGYVAPAVAAWVICTQLKDEEYLSYSMYLTSASRGLSLPQDTIKGYHYWAIPFTKLMRRKDWLGYLTTLSVIPLARARCNHLSGSKNILGFLTVILGEPICALIGWCLSKKESKDWRILYA